MRAYALIAFALVLTCPVALEGQESMPDSTLRYGDPVEFRDEQTPDWNQGIIGRIGGCLVVLRQSEPSNRWMRVPFDQITELRLVENSGPTDDAPAKAGYQRLDMEAVRRVYGACRVGY